MIDKTYFYTGLKLQIVKTFYSVIIIQKFSKTVKTKNVDVQISKR